MVPEVGDHGAYAAVHEVLAAQRPANAHRIDRIVDCMGVDGGGWRPPAPRWRPGVSLMGCHRMTPAAVLPTGCSRSRGPGRCSCAPTWDPASARGWACRRRCCAVDPRWEPTTAAVPQAPWTPVPPEVSSSSAAPHRIHCSQWPPEFVGGSSRAAGAVNAVRPRRCWPGERQSGRASPVGGDRSLAGATRSLVERHAGCREHGRG